MEPLIRHVRFFNGQFLRQEEFNEEQGYSNHMRRRLSYALFEDGVMEISTADLTIERENPTDATNKRVRIGRGMAVGANTDVLESREIILREDSPFSNLSSVASAGQVVYVTVNFLRSEAVAVPVGSSTENSRVVETAEVRYHPRAAADPIPAGMFVGQDPMILVGSINFTSMGAGPQCRQVARLRSYLFAPAPSISISPANVTLAATPLTVILTVTPNGGLSLSALVMSDFIFSDLSGISARALLPGTMPDGSRQLQFVLAPGSPPGTRTITLNVPAPAPSAGFGIDAFVAPPTLTAPSPNPPVRGVLLTINGTNFVSPTTVSFNGANNVPHTVVSSAQITLTVPGAANAGPMTVSARGGTASRNVGMSG